MKLRYDIQGDGLLQYFLLFLCSLNIHDKMQGLTSLAEAVLSLQRDTMQQLVAM